MIEIGFARNALRTVTAAVTIDRMERRRETNEILRAVRFLNRSDVQNSPQGTKYAFGHDPESRRPTVQLVDKASGVVLYQIPTAEALRAVANLRLRLIQQRIQREITDGFVEE